MKLAFFSDLHADENQNEMGIDIIFYLIEYIKVIKPDYIVISGDIANGADTSIRYLERIEDETGIPVLYVPGNHDMWNRYSSFEEEYFKLKEHHTSLIDNPRQLTKDWVVIGDLGWYDYSFRDPNEYSIDQCVEYKADYWQGDQHCIVKDKSDIDICDLFLDKFEKLLKNHDDKKMIFVNHFIPYEEYLVYKPNQFIWNFCNAYMGSKKLGTLLERFPQVKYVAFGHTHKRFGLVKHNDKHVICSPLGYVHEWKSEDVFNEIKNSCCIVEI